MQIGDLAVRKVVIKRQNMFEALAAPSNVLPVTQRSDELESESRNRTRLAQTISS